ncbi:hypothetical protein QTP88_009421 [Uroleucon formosanum]
MEKTVVLYTQTVLYNIGSKLKIVCVAVLKTIEKLCKNSSLYLKTILHAAKQYFDKLCHKIQYCQIDVSDQLGDITTLRNVCIIVLNINYYFEFNSADLMHFGAWCRILPGLIFILFSKRLTFIHILQIKNQINILNVWCNYKKKDNLRFLLMVNSSMTDVAMSLSKKKKVLLHLLLEEVEEEEMIINHNILCNKTKKVHEMFQTRKIEGFFNILIKKHLYREDRKFREFFRLSWDQFNYVLNLIEDYIKINLCNRVVESITAAEKLAITSR